MGKHTVSASFTYDQTVKVSKIGKGKIKYIGLTNFSQNYWFGIKLENNITKNMKTDDCIHYLQKNEINEYFNADPTKSIFVRSNRLKSIPQSNGTPKKSKKSKKNKVCKNKKHKKPKTKHIASTRVDIECNDKHLNESMLAMMNKLDIPHK